MMQKLFGGAIECEIPKGFIDASLIRQIPDNQEVYLENDGNASIIVELLEMIEVADNESAAYHFYAVAENNCAETAEIISIESKGQRGDWKVSTLLGMQSVAKYGKRHAENVELCMAVLRNKRLKIDILITCNLLDLAALESVLSTFQVVDESLFVQ